VDSSGNYVSESGWSGNVSGAQSPGCTNQGGSGGGYSPFPRPWWQTGLLSGSVNRGAPDIALDAGTPVGVVYDGGESAVAGTSLSTPVWAGIAAVADQYSGGRLGLLNPSLYAIAAGVNYSRDFHDIVTGNNGYPAGPGWDPVTGLGTPRVALLVTDLAHRVSVSASNLASFVYATPRFGKAPLTVTFHVNATGGTGTYPLEGVSFGDENASFAPEGSATYTYPSPGVYSAQAYVADSRANYSVSPPVAVVVGGGHALTVSLAASTTTPALGAAVLFSATASGGVAPYEYNFSFGDGTYLDGSLSSSTSHTFGDRGSFCAAVVVQDNASAPDGGASARVAIGVGGAPPPDCRNDTLPFTMTATPGVGVRDAPADFPDLFSVSGGSTSAGTLPPSVQFSSSDPYAAACGCAIFRAAGTYPVTGYANDSENEQTNATTTVTVAPPLVANFTASPLYGPAPLTVTFRANASGGYDANASTTTWTSGDVLPELGSRASFTFPTPGEFVVVGQLSDRGHGNASEAFLIDVQAASGGATPSLTATVRPAVDVPLGATVNFSAQSVSASGIPVPSEFLWTFASGSGAFRPAFDWTPSAPFSGAGNRTLDATLTATDLATGVPVRTAFELGNFTALEAGGFVPRADALSLSDPGGPQSGAAPLSWSDRAAVSGPGSVGVLWTFGDGAQSSSTTVTHSFSAGTYSVFLTVHDSFGDVALDAHPVEVSGTLAVAATLSATTGNAPLTLSFGSVATGGLGPPYRYVWDFGNLTNVTAANGTFTFDTPGVYSVTLNASDTDHDSLARNWTVTVTSAPATFPIVILLAAGAGVGVGMALAVTMGGRRRTGGGTASP